MPAGADLIDVETQLLEAPLLTGEEKGKSWLRIDPDQGC